MPVFSPQEVAGWSGGTWMNGCPPAVGSITQDTRLLRERDLYVALVGARLDGHDFVEKAAAMGACGAVVARTRAGSLGVRLPLLAVDDPLRALQDMASAYRRKIGAPIVGITGSTGKTTVKEMIADMLATRLPTARSKGNWNNEVGLPLSLLAMEADCRAGVFELGISHPGEMAPLCRIAQPTWGVMTPIGPVHLEFFAGVEAIAREKGEMLRCLPADGAAVLCVDEPWFDLLRSMSRARVITVSRTSDADYRLAAWDGNGSCVIEDRIDGGRHSLRIPLPGEHIAHDALLAVAVARGFGVEWPQIAEALSRYRPLPMRWETRSAAGMTVINDAYNSNPLSLAAALRTFQRMPFAGRKWLVLGGMLEIGAGAGAEHRRIGGVVAEGDWAGLMVVGDLGAAIADGAAESGMAPERIRRFKTPAEAGEFLRGAAAAGDAILLKASRGIHLEEALPLIGDLPNGCARDTMRS